MTDLSPVGDIQAVGLVPMFNSVVEQVSYDLQTQLETFRDPKIGLRLLSQKMGIHEKTLGRLLRGENKPGYQTLYKIYRCLLNEKDDARLLERLPKVICEAIKKGNPKKLEGNRTYTLNILQELKQNTIFQELYFLCACHPLSLAEVKEQYGLKGMKVLERMLELQVLEESSPLMYTLGKNQTNIDAAGLLTIGSSLSQSFFRPQMSDDEGENYIALYAEGLSEEAYNNWIKIDEEAFAKKVELSKQTHARGTLRAITFMLTEKMKLQTEKNYE